MPSKASHSVLTPRWTALPPLSLYIHVPWCVRKCPYCDFNSHALDPHALDTNKEAIPEERYIEALLDDLDEDLSLVQDRRIESIFIGGGTPSLLSAKAYQKLLAGIHQRLILKEDCEITLEANPGTFEQAKFAGFKEAGINRLSIGIQSFNPEHLAALGRIHDGEEAINAVKIAKMVGFERINLDLMHGLPSQSVEQALEDLQQAVDLSPTHISWYQLTLEPNTEFYSKPPTLPDDERLWTITQQGQALLADSGFAAYEVSAYAVSELEQARHNLNYWTFGDYLGIGAGAHGKSTLLQSQQIVRTQKMRVPKQYLDVNKPYLSQKQPIKPEELPFEFFMNTLRLVQGCPTKAVAYTGVPLATLMDYCQPLVNNGWLEMNAERIKATALGQRFLNSLLEQLLP